MALYGRQRTVQPSVTQDTFFPYGKNIWFPANFIILGNYHTVVIGPGFHWDLRISKPCGLHQQETMAPSGYK